MCAAVMRGRVSIPRFKIEKTVKLYRNVKKTGSGGYKKIHPQPKNSRQIVYGRRGVAGKVLCVSLRVWATPVSRVATGKLAKIAKICLMNNFSP